mgnify:CR=1 FL=1
MRHYKPCVLVVNKWDLADGGHTQEQYIEYLDEAVRGLARMADCHGLPWTASYSTDIGYEILTWTLESPLEDAWGLFDYR